MPDRQFTREELAAYDASRTAAPTPPTDQNLRDRIARALAEVTVGHTAFVTVDVEAEYPRADAVLAVLPESRRAFDPQAGLQRLADDLTRGDQPTDGTEAPARLLFWEPSDGGSYHDGRITIPVAEGASFTATAPVGDLVLQLPAARALWSQLASLMNDAAEEQP
ncbi:hypothetical protein [Streptomyces sp. NPDC002564]|uniref:hypothetical protein n=1 Tax=Streptomyces sp. NPDC002564 TaxID=3364649 RepID=UPI0036AC26D7